MRCAGPIVSIRYAQALLYLPTDVAFVISHIRVFFINISSSSSFSFHCVHKQISRNCQLTKKWDSLPPNNSIFSPLLSFSTNKLLFNFVAIKSSWKCETAGTGTGVGEVEGKSVATLCRISKNFPFSISHLHAKWRLINLRPSQLKLTFNRFKSLFPSPSSTLLSLIPLKICLRQLVASQQHSCFFASLCYEINSFTNFNISSKKWKK